ncbi:MAG: hypothetical protein ACI88G_002045, partial [Woeseiaceae bacterium]
MTAKGGQEMASKDDLMKGFEFGRWSVLPERGLIC